MRRITFLFSLFVNSILPVYGQQTTFSFKPGFDQREADELLRLNFVFLDTSTNNLFSGFQPGYTLKYRSASMGLDNAWDLWIRSDSVAVITLRGTTADPRSILADFYCAMMPARGQILISGTDTISYHLANHPRAAVHAGFLVGFAFLSRDISPILDSLYRGGYRNFLVAGHSQGGALCYYVSAWMLYLERTGRYPGIRIKTYASAPPKMGNMYFAYDYDNLTRAEWTFSIVNSADAVPEMPFTTQQVKQDMNEPNPILRLQASTGKLPWLKRIVVRRAFRKMIKNASKSSEAYQHYLGGYAANFLRKAIPGISLPEPVNTTYFVRPGVPITLVINEAYTRFFSVNDGPYFHHGVVPYRYLLRQYYKGLAEMTPEEMDALLKIGQH